jgi:hypothetical protein
VALVVDVMKVWSLRRGLLGSMMDADDLESTYTRVNNVCVIESEYVYVIVSAYACVRECTLCVIVVVEYLYCKTSQCW